LKTYETPTSIASCAYCPRLGGLGKFYPYGGAKTNAMVIGNIEHTAFQEYYNLMRLDCLRHDIDSFMSSENDCHKIRLDKVIKYLNESSKIQYPSFVQHIDDNMPSLEYRLNLHHKQKISDIQYMIRHGEYDFAHAISTSLPFVSEKTLAAYDIVGRVDCVYLGADGSSLIPEDLKSHESKLDSLIHRNSTKTQIVTYAVLLEEAYHMKVNTGRIFYTRDLTYDTFDITAEDKQQIFGIKEQLQQILQEGLPPIIDDPLRCQHCYRNQLCAKVAEEGPTITYKSMRKQS